MSTPTDVQPCDTHPGVPEWQHEVVALYGEHLNNTGGNDPLDLLNDLATKKNLASTNIVVFTLAAAVSSQVKLLGDLRAVGLLRDPLPKAAA